MLGNVAARYTEKPAVRAQLFPRRAKAGFGLFPGSYASWVNKDVKHGIRILYNKRALQKGIRKKFEANRKYLFVEIGNLWRAQRQIYCRIMVKYFKLLTIAVWNCDYHDFNDLPTRFYFYRY